MYSPESIDDSVLEFSNFQNDYEFEHTLFNDIGLDMSKEETLEFGSHSKENPAGFISCNDPAISPVHSSTSVSELVSLNHSGDTHVNMNAATKVTSSSLGMDTLGPLELYISNEEEENRKRYPIGDSNSKNAIAARDNRMKKKKYVAELEETVNTLRTDNEIMSKEVMESRSRLSALESEVHYLKSVIANQSTLSAILNSVSKTPGISLQTSFGDNMKEHVGRTNTNTDTILKSNNHSKGKCATRSKTNERNLRSRANVAPKSLQNKGVQNMTAKEIVQRCKEKKRKMDVIHVTDSGSDTDSELEEINVVDDSSQHKPPWRPQLNVEQVAVWFSSVTHRCLTLSEFNGDAKSRCQFSSELVGKR